MNRLSPATALLVLTTATALFGCFSGKVAYIRDGDARSVNISYRGDISTAIPLAKQHCAQFERVPQLIQADDEVASFDCRRP